MALLRDRATATARSSTRPGTRRSARRCSRRSPRRRRAEGAPGTLLGHGGADVRRARGWRRAACRHRCCCRASRATRSVVFGNRVVLKMFRRPQEGMNPDLEIGRFLTERRGSSTSPPLLGALEYRRGRERAHAPSACCSGTCPTRATPGTTRSTRSGLLRRAAARRTTLPDELDAAARRGRPAGAGRRRAAARAGATRPSGPTSTRPSCSGERTAELHLALAAGPTTAAFAPEPFTTLYQRSLYQSMRTLVRADAAAACAGRPAARTTAARGADVLDREAEVARRASTRLRDHRIDASRIRVHGDYHLGQVLYAGRDFVIIDFEGEPPRSPTERRIKRGAADRRGRDGAVVPVRGGRRARARTRAALRPDRASPAALEPWAGLVALGHAAFLRATSRRPARRRSCPRDPRRPPGAARTAYCSTRRSTRCATSSTTAPDWVRIPLRGVPRSSTPRRGDVRPPRPTPDELAPTVRRLAVDPGYWDVQGRRRGPEAVPAAVAALGRRSIGDRADALASALVGPVAADRRQTALEADVRRAPGGSERGVADVRYRRRRADAGSRPGLARGARGRRCCRRDPAARARDSGAPRRRLSRSPAGADATVVSLPAVVLPGIARRARGASFAAAATRCAPKSDLGRGGRSRPRRADRWIDGLGGEVVGTLPLLAAFLDEPCDPARTRRSRRLFWNELYLDLAATPELARSARARERWPDDARGAPRADAAGRLPAARTRPSGRCSRPLAASCFGARADARAGGVRTLRGDNPDLVDYAPVPRRRRADPQRPGTRGRPGSADGRLAPRRLRRDAVRFHLYAQWSLTGSSARWPSDRRPASASTSTCRSARAATATTPGSTATSSPGASRRRRAARRLLRRGPELGLPARCTRSDARGRAIATLRGLPAPPHGARRHAAPRPRDGPAPAVLGARRHGGRPRASTCATRPRSCSPCSPSRPTAPAPRVVGEDLGTVPDEVRDAMDRHGVAAQVRGRVRARRPDADGAPARPPVASVASLNTHDMPTFAAFWRATTSTTAGGSACSTRARRGGQRAERARLPERMTRRFVDAGGSGRAHADGRAAGAADAAAPSSRREPGSLVVVSTTCGARPSRRTCRARRPSGPTGGSALPTRSTARSDPRSWSVGGGRPPPRRGGSPRARGLRARSSAPRRPTHEHHRPGRARRPLRRHPLGDDDLWLFNEGTPHPAVRAARRPPDHEPAAARVPLRRVGAERRRRVGDRRLQRLGPAARTRSTPRGSSGIWAGFVAGRRPGTCYKFHIAPRAAGYGVDKADPFAFTRASCRRRPRSVVWDLAYEWDDADWMADRAGATRSTCADAIYEVHLGSWARRPSDVPVAQLPRARPRSWPSTARELGLHPRRAAAGHGAPVLRLVGLPDDRATSRRPAGSARRRTSCTSSTRCTRPASA